MEIAVTVYDDLPGFHFLECFETGESFSFVMDTCCMEHNAKFMLGFLEKVRNG